MQYALLYSFKGDADGAQPAGTLLKAGTLLYRTTYYGGDGKGCHCGTVFSIATGGVEKRLYAFKGTGSGDGGNPSGALIDVYLADNRATGAFDRRWPSADGCPRRRRQAMGLA